MAFTRQKDGGWLFSMRLPASAKMSEISQVAFTPDGKLLAIANDKKVLLLWSVTAAGVTQVAELGLTGSIEQMRISPDGRWLAMAGARGVMETAGRGYGRGKRTPARMRRLRFEYFVSVVDLHKREALPDKWSNDAKCESLSFTADSKHLVVLRVQSVSSRQRGLGEKAPAPPPAEILAFETGRWEQAWLTKVNKRDLRTVAVWGADNPVVYSDYRRLFVLDRTTQKSRKLRVQHGNGVDALRVHHGAKLLLSTAQPLTRPAEVFVWQMPAGRLKRRFRYGRKEEPAQATFLGSRYVLGLANTPMPADRWKPDVGLGRGSFRIWDIQTGRQVKRVAKLPVKVITATSSNTGWVAIGGRLLFKGGDSECRLLIYPPGTLLRF